MSRFANKSKFNSFYTLLQLPGITIDGVHIDDHKIEINAQIKGKSAMCPMCGKKSTRVHSRYYRKLQDLSVFTKEVSIRLRARKFICTNSRCQRKIFSQQLSSGLDRYSRRTTRATELLTQMSLEVSARKGSWLSRLTKVPVSPSTCLRLAGRSVISPRDDLIHIGIDDWAWRKGHTYGTILVDRETGKSIDLLKSREKEDVVRWLKAHPTIETVTRDRAGCYSQSINTALPSAIQVADRFHLVVNYSEYVQKIIRQMLPALTKTDFKKLIPTDTGNDQNIQRLIDLAHSGQPLLTEYKRQLIDKASISFII